MLSNEHEGLVELFRHQPALAAELAADLGVDAPRHTSAALEPNDYSDVTPAEWRSDGVVALTNDAGKRAMAIVVEVQRGRERAKPLAWPVYVTATRARLKCPVVLMVVCPDPTIARWSAKPIETGHPGFVLRPLVLGPDRVPVVTDPELARRLPELAVLSAAAHGAHPDIGKILSSLLEGLNVVDDAHGALYAEFVLTALPEEAQRQLEEIMSVGTFDYTKSEFARRYFGEALDAGRAKGKAEGKAEDVLAVLAARGIDVSYDERDRINSCADADQLDEWVRRAATAHSVDELFT